MKKMRFVAIGATMILAGSLAFAQSSMTNTATKGVFKTDVDNYMDVNTWGGVQPEKIFAFTNFYSSSLNLGAAKSFGNFYLGAYFSGNIPRIQTYQNKTDDYTVDVSTSGYSSTTVPTGLSTLATGVTFPTLTYDIKSLNFSLLFGFGNIGIKAGLYYYPNNLSAKVNYTDASTDDIAYNWTSDEIEPFLRFGYTTELAGKSFMVNASASFWFNQQKTEITQGSTTTIYNGSNSYNVLSFTAGATYEFYKTESIAHSAAFNATYQALLYPKEISIVNGSAVTTQDYSGGYVYFAPSYKFTFTPVEAVSLGLTAIVPFNISFRSTSSKYSSFNMGATVNMALQYTIKPDFLFFNLGGRLSLGNLIQISSDNDSRNNQNQFFTGSSIDLSTGLTFNFTKNISLDTSFDFMDSSQMASLDDIWKTKIGLQLSIKY